MGREIRKVPANWEHPRDENGRYIPMYERSYATVIAEWFAEHNLWLLGQHPDQLEEKPDDDYKASNHKFYAQWGGNPPDVEYYNTFYTEAEATWFQLYQTVSEGTPVTPPFATTQELIDYLVEHGDFWYQKDFAEGRDTFRTKPTRAQAESLVGTGWAPSGIVVIGETGVLDAYQQQDLKQ